MLRSRKIILISHCLMNVNSKVEGLATYESALEELLVSLVKKGYGIYQLPCPELRLYGMKRWGQTVSQYNNIFYEKHCTDLACEVVREIREYKRCSYSVDKVIGLDGSPSCGVSKTFIGEWGGLDHSGEAGIGPGEGVFFRCLREQCDKSGLTLRFIGLDESDPSTSVKDLINTL